MEQPTTQDQSVSPPRDSWNQSTRRPENHLVPSHTSTTPLLLAFTQERTYSLARITTSWGILEMRLRPAQREDHKMETTKIQVGITERPSDYQDDGSMTPTITLGLCMGSDFIRIVQEEDTDVYLVEVPVAVWDRLEHEGCIVWESGPSGYQVTAEMP